MADKSSENSSVIGTAKTAIIFNLAGDRQAIISSVHAQVSSKKLPQRVAFIGPVELNTESQANIQSICLEIIDRILNVLGVETPDYQISITSPGAISSQDANLEVEGFSAALSILMAMASAALQIPIPQDIVLTGHMASADGNVGQVSGLADKLKASIDDPSIAEFIYPSIETDQSLKILTPLEYQKIKQAIDESRGDIHVVGVEDIADAFTAAFDEDDIALSSLMGGYFGKDNSNKLSGGPIDRAAAFLLRKNSGRFWKALEVNLLAKHIDRARLFIKEFVLYHIKFNKYPSEFGEHLSKLVMSLPPGSKKSKDLFPLLPMNECINLAQNATENDYPDVQLLIDTTQGKLAMASTTVTPVKAEKLAEPDSLLSFFIEALSAENIAREIYRPIDEARASYQMDSIQASDHKEFNESITAFYIHLYRHLEQFRGFIAMGQAMPGALDLLQNTFQNHGGINAAYSEGLNPVRGGLRYIFDLMTERLKLEAKEKHIRTVFKGTLDPLDFDKKIAMIKAFMKRVGPNLPAEIRNCPAKQFALDYEAIIRAYSESLEKVIELLKIL
jgi:hypothetical protein